MIGMMVMGRLVYRFDARIFVLIGFVLLGLSLWQMTQFTDNVGETYIVLSGVVQGLGLGCIFVPLSTLSFATLPAHYRVEATPLYNLVRNLGSSIGISLMITALSQNTQTNHAAFSSYITPFAFALREPVESGLLNLDSPAGLMMINGFVTRQAVLLAYLQDFRMMMWVCFAMIPIVFLIRAPTPQPIPG